MANERFPVELQLRIDWSELDYFGHVNNVSYFKYIQAARVNYWDRIGLTQSHLRTGIGPMLVSCKCDFKQALFYPGKLSIHTKLEYIKNTSFSFSHRILNGNGEIAAEAQDVMVMFDFKRNEKVAFPDELKEIIGQLENKN